MKLCGRLAGVRILNSIYFIITPSMSNEVKLLLFCYINILRLCYIGGNSIP